MADSETCHVGGGRLCPAMTAALDMFSGLNHGLSRGSRERSSDGALRHGVDLVGRKGKRAPLAFCPWCRAALWSEYPAAKP